MQKNQDPLAMTPDIPAWLSYLQELFRSSISRKFGYGIAAFLFALGLMCLFFVDFIYRLIPYIMGGFMLAIGGLALLAAIISKEYKRIDTKLSSSGILFLAVGCAIIIKGRNADGLIGVVWGIFGLLQCSESLNIAIYRLTHKGKWLSTMLQAIVQLTLALLLLVDPVSKLYPHMRLLGTEMLVMAIHIFHEVITAPKEEPHNYVI